MTQLDYKFNNMNTNTNGAHQTNSYNVPHSSNPNRNSAQITVTATARGSNTQSNATATNTNTTMKMSISDWSNIRPSAAVRGPLDAINRTSGGRAGQTGQIQNCQGAGLSQVQYSREVYDTLPAQSGQNNSPKSLVEGSGQNGGQTTQDGQTSGQNFASGQQMASKRAAFPTRMQPFVRRATRGMG